jgi:AraC-like DNA-binding protein
MPSSEPAACTNQLQCSTSPLKSSAADRPRTGVLDSHPAENKVTAQQDVLNLLRCMLGSLQSGMQDYIDMTVAVSSTRMCIVVCLTGGEVVNEGSALLPAMISAPEADGTDPRLIMSEGAERANGTIPETSNGTVVEGRFTLDLATLDTFFALLRRGQAAYGIKTECCRGGLTPARLRRVLNHIAANLHENNSLHQLADLAKLSSHHFAHAFKQSTGLSPHKYILQQRIARAQQLLEQRELTILEISHSLGFCSQGHFTRAFAREIGIPPGKYRHNIVGLLPISGQAGR